MIFEIKIKDTTDPEEYIKHLRQQVSEYLRTYFYDGPFDEDILMSAIMRQTKGKVNPHQIISIVRSFIEFDGPKFLFEYQG